jgi:hypothetical protein
MARDICRVDANGKARESTGAKTGAKMNGTGWHGKAVRPVDPTAGASP